MVLQGGRKQIAVGVQLLVDAYHVVVEVAEVVVEVVVEQDFVSPHQRVEHLAQRGHHTAQVDHVATHTVRCRQVLAAAGVAPHQRLLDLLHLILQAGHHAEVPIHDLVKDDVCHERATPLAELGAGPQQAVAQVRYVHRGVMPDGDHVVRRNKDAQLVLPHAFVFY